MNDVQGRLVREVRREHRADEGDVIGVYSNFLGVWHTAHEFTLDFAPDELVVHVDAAAQPDAPGILDDGTVLSPAATERLSIDTIGPRIVVRGRPRHCRTARSNSSTPRTTCTTIAIAITASQVLVVSSGSQPSFA